MLYLLLLGLLTTCHYTEGRKSGDPLAVGEKVGVRVFVEGDEYFRVVACGLHQCGGVRVDGVQGRGMGYRTYVADANAFLKEKLILKQDYPYGTQFFPGREYTFHVVRPSEQEMQVWLEGNDKRVAEVKLEPGVAFLYVVFKSGTYRFLGEQDAPSKIEMIRRKCASSNGQKYKPAEQITGDSLEVSMACRFKSEDKLQPMCIVYLMVEGEKGKRELYRSQVPRDKYDPQLTEMVKIPYVFQEAQMLEFAVFSQYSDCDTPDDADLRVSIKTPLATVNTKGKVEVSETESSGDVYSALYKLNCDEKITLEFSGKQIPGTGDVFLKIMKSPSDSSADKNFGYTEVARTNKVLRDSSFLKWDDLTVSVNELCDGEYDRPLKVYALEQVGDDEDNIKLIGQFQTTLNELKEPKNRFQLTDNTMQAQSDGTNDYSGQIWVGEIPQNHTFSQYIAVGFELVGTVQIDFTASNGNPLDPASLHYVSSDPNKYETAIDGVGEIVEKYIADGVFKAYGFGADLPGSSETSQAFNVNFTADTPDCTGVKGVLQAYHKSIREISLNGPTLYAPVLRKLIDTARQYEDGSKYFIHLLLTDGDLHDFNETKQAVSEASKLPISVIMVGIGGSDFSLMKSLAELPQEKPTNVTFWNEGERGLRDIVQVVEMNAFLNGTATSLKRKLAKTVLAKIPPQYIEFMKIKKIPPKPPRNSTITRVC